VPEVLAVRGQDLHLRGSIGTGVLYAGVPPEADIVSIVDDLRTVCEHAVVLTAPPGARERLDLWGPVPGLQLMRQVKAQFDPGRRFAPGRFAGGI
jgi:glycolate oxidase FAD binding subunit